MILRDKVQILDELLNTAKDIVAQHTQIANTATRALSRAEVYMQNSTDPKEIIDMYRRIHDMQMQILTTLTAILDKFPVEHSIQELQMLELYRNLTERQKQQFYSTLETLILQKRHK